MEEEKGGGVGVRTSHGNRKLGLLSKKNRLLARISLNKTVVKEDDKSGPEEDEDIEPHIAQLDSLLDWKPST